MPWYDPRSYTDKTITSATGASQSLVSANPSRRSLIIKNGAASTGVNLTGGTASIGGAGTLTLLPYEGLYLSDNDCPLGAVTVFSTSGAYVSALEGN